MNKYILYCGLLLATFITSCSKEEVLLPSDYDQNWFSVKDNASDATDHAIFQLYQKFTIPVFYKDTIGSQERVDNFGNKYTYYEVLGVNYDLSSTVTAVDYYQNVQDKSNILPVVNFLNTDVLPTLPKGVFIPSILLIDSMSSPISGQYAHRGFNTVVISAIPRFLTMDATERKKFKGAILRAMIGKFVNGSDNASWLTANFYSVSRAFYTKKDIYASGVYEYELKNAKIPTLLDAGFLTKNTTIEDWGWPQTPPTYLDVNSYVEAAFSYSTAEFTDLYGKYPPVMLKYNRMKTLLVKMGFTFE
jgi:hypothetical protein